MIGKFCNCFFSFSNFMIGISTHSLQLASSYIPQSGQIHPNSWGIISWHGQPMTTRGESTLGVLFYIILLCFILKNDFLQFSR